jgi:hypothetical protein
VGRPLLQLGSWPRRCWESLSRLTVADVMLARPKTLPSERRRRSCGSAPRDHVQKLLVTDGRVFRGALTRIPEEADPASAALECANPVAKPPSSRVVKEAVCYLFCKSTTSRGYQTGTSTRADAGTPEHCRHALSADLRDKRARE